MSPETLYLLQYTFCLGSRVADAGIILFYVWMSSVSWRGCKVLLNEVEPEVTRSEAYLASSDWRRM